MPLYDFRCPTCEAVFEADLPAGGQPGNCLVCGASEPRRVYGPVASLRGPALRGLQAKRSTGQRQAREEKRWNGFRAQRERLGLPPRGPSPD